MGCLKLERRICLNCPAECRDCIVGGGVGGGRANLNPKPAGGGAAPLCKSSHAACFLNPSVCCVLSDKKWRSINACLIEPVAAADGKLLDSIAFCPCVHGQQTTV